MSTLVVPQPLQELIAQHGMYLGYRRAADAEDCVRFRFGQVS